MGKPPLPVQLNDSISNLRRTQIHSEITVRRSVSARGFHKPHFILDGTGRPKEQRPAVDAPSEAGTVDGSEMPDILDKHRVQQDATA